MTLHDTRTRHTTTVVASAAIAACLAVSCNGDIVDTIHDPDGPGGSTTDPSSPGYKPGTPGTPDNNTLLPPKTDCTSKEFTPARV